MHSFSFHGKHGKSKNLPNFIFELLWVIAYFARPWILDSRKYSPVNLAITSPAPTDDKDKFNRNGRCTNYCTCLFSTAFIFSSSLTALVDSFILVGPFYQLEWCNISKNKKFSCLWSLAVGDTNITHINFTGFIQTSELWNRFRIWGL